MPYRMLVGAAMAPALPPGCWIRPGFVSPAERNACLSWLGTLRPLWERRFPDDRPPPRGEAQRELVRPVYWLGSWQFACLGYYGPPRRVRDRAIAAEPFPPPLAAWVQRIEGMIRRSAPPDAVPPGWALTTCLVNFYGRRRVGDRWEDRARVGAHRDDEAGPVASVSLGARAFFQFVTRQGAPVHDLWLEDGSLQVFFGRTCKEVLLHRVQRVERGPALLASEDGFETRRINFTFRWVNPADVVRWSALPPQPRRDTRVYVEQLAAHHPFWAQELALSALTEGTSLDAAPLKH